MTDSQRDRIVNGLAARPRRGAVWLVALAGAVAAWAAAAGPARADDPEGCLMCHRYRGLAAVDRKNDRVGLYYVSPEYYQHDLGPHVQIRCTGCHLRDEVAVVPHKPVTPVDCTRACHLVGPQQLAKSFGHGPIADMLKGSVHTQAVLDRSNELLGSPLGPGQSRCLLCHDEPTFRRPGETWAQQEAPIGRCNVCHSERLPVDTRYYYWHVFARSRPARDKPDVVRVCGLCHANEKIRDDFKLPNSIASYMASFHGKAVLLGSRQTAACLDCHVADMHNVHEVSRHTSLESAVSPAHLQDTCRSPSCHPKAGARISSAAVHLDLATDRGIEYVIACLFILLILFTFGPSVMLTALKMLQVVVGRHDPGDHDRRRRAERLMAAPRGRQLLMRFNPHQRVQHWILMAAFTALVLTGFPMKFADRPWAAWIISVLGGLGAARVIHRVAGVVLIVAMLYHLGYIARTLIRNKRASGAGWIRAVFDLPMMITWRDLKQMAHLMAFLLFLRRTRPQFARFNLEEKFEYIGVFWGTFLLGATGALMWANAWTSQHFPGRLLTIATLVHTMEALLALLHVGVVHMISVIFAPGVFPISRAMFTGETPAEEIAEAHGAMLDAAGQQLGLVEEAEEVAHG